MSSPRRFQRASFLLAAVFAAGCSHGSGALSPVPQAAVQPGAPETAVLKPLAPAEADRVIPASLSARERGVLYNSIPRIPSVVEAHRLAKPENVTIVSIDASTGAVISNNMQAAHALQRHTIGGSGAVGTSDSRRSPRSYQETEKKNSGPYRRIRTYANSPVVQGASSDFTYEYADVQLHCNNGNVKIPVGYKGNYAYDAGHAYLGGWSNGGNAVDAGLQYNLNVGPGAADNYTPFLRTDHYIYDFYDRTNNRNAPYPDPQTTGNNYHIECNARSMVRISYSVQRTTQTPYGYPDNGTLMIASFNYNDVFGNYHVIDVSIYGQNQSSVLGWTPDCAGCKYKLMTSIAQADPNSQGNQRDAFSDGDYFRAEWRNMHVSCGLRQNGCFGLPNNPSEAVWDSQTTEGCTEHPSWSFPNYDTGRAGCGNTASGFHEVQVQNFTFSGEDDYIDLAPKVADTGSCGGFGWRHVLSSTRGTSSAVRCPSSGGAVYDGYSCSPDDPSCDTGTDCNLTGQVDCNPPEYCDPSDPNGFCYNPGIDCSSDPSQPGCPGYKPPPPCRPISAPACNGGGGLSVQRKTPPIQIESRRQPVTGGT